MREEELECSGRKPVCFGEEGLVGGLQALKLASALAQLCPF